MFTICITISITTIVTISTTTIIIVIIIISSSSIAARSHDCIKLSFKDGRLLVSTLRDLLEGRLQVDQARLYIYIYIYVYTHIQNTYVYIYIYICT